MAFKHGNQTLITIDGTGATQLQSATGKDIALYPDNNIWIKQGTKLIFEGTAPDDYEAKLQATSVTADRDIILPDESGTLATQAYVTSAISGGAIGDTDSLPEGSTNLYYTDGRVDLRIASANLSDLADVDDSARADTYVLTWENATSTWIAAPTASTYGTADFNTDLATKTTADLAEGTSLYYTDERVDDRVSNLIVAGTNITTTYDDAAGTFTINASSVGGYDLSSNTTTDLAEGTNLYYTDARADARITNALGGNVVIGGDLTVSGTTTTVNSNTVNIGDSIITLNSDETGAPSQNGGIEIERGTSTNVSFVWDETNDEWTTSAQTLKTGHFLPEADVTYDLGSTSLKWRDLYLSGTTINLGGATLSASGANLSLGGGGSFDLSSNTTDNLTEGSNLYYTDTRARTHIEGADLDLGTNKITYSNVYATTADLPSAASYHGMFAHVHAEGKGYFAHSSAWRELVDTSSSTGVDIQFNSIGAGTAAAGTAGDIRATADVTAYYSSDERLKENVVEIDNAINKVKKIRGVEFDWSQEYLDAKGGEDEYFVRKHDVGVIAQEIETVLPEVVGTREDGIKAVKYDRIVALLIEAIKEQQSEIEELKKKLG